VPFAVVVPDLEAVETVADLGLEVASVAAGTQEEGVGTDPEK